MGTAMSTNTSVDDELKVALAAFETRLATPLISGELADWVDALRTAWIAVSNQLSDHLEHLHPQQYQQMGEADPEILPRIQSLEAEDCAMEGQRQQLDATIARTAQHLPKMEPDEDKANQHIKNLVDDGLAFIARVRKQEVAIQTWFVEAFNRDHGAGD